MGLRRLFLRVVAAAVGFSALLWLVVRRPRLPEGNPPEAALRGADFEVSERFCEQIVRIATAPGDRGPYLQWLKEQGTLPWIFCVSFHLELPL